MAVYGNNYIMPPPKKKRHVDITFSLKKIPNYVILEKINASIRAYILIIHYFCN